MGERWGWIGLIHRRTDVALGYGLRPHEAAVVRGMVLGDRSLMPEELETAFQRSGVTLTPMQNRKTVEGFTFSVMLNEGGAGRLELAKA